MSEDLIKRADVIKAIHNYWKKRLDTLPTADIQQTDKILEHNKTLCNFINAIPSAYRPQEWIPCSERLPQYRDAVLISTFWGVRVAERDGIKEDGTDDFWYLFLDDATAHPRYVYAWMPLPEPWRDNEQ